MRDFPIYMVLHLICLPFLDPNAGSIIATEIFRVNAAVHVQGDASREIGGHNVPHVYSEGVLMLVLRGTVDCRIHNELHVPELCRIVVVYPRVGVSLEGVVAVDQVMRRQGEAIVKFHL